MALRVVHSLILMATQRIIGRSDGFTGIVRGQDHFFDALRARCNCALEGLDMADVARKFLTKLQFTGNPPGNRGGVATRRYYGATVWADNFFNVE